MLVLRLFMVPEGEDLIDLGRAAATADVATAITGERVGGRVVAVEDVERPEDERRNGLGFAGVCVRPL